MTDLSKQVAVIAIAERESGLENLDVDDSIWDTFRDSLELQEFLLRIREEIGPLPSLAEIEEQNLQTFGDLADALVC
jgi:hypothetical protein